MSKFVIKTARGAYIGQNKGWGHVEARTTDEALDYGSHRRAALWAKKFSNAYGAGNLTVEEVQ